MMFEVEENITKLTQSLENLSTSSQNMSTGATSTEWLTRSFIFDYSN